MACTNLYATPRPLAWALLVFPALALSTAAVAAPPARIASDRIAGPIVAAGTESNRGVRLNGNVRPQATPENDRGALDPETAIADIKLMLQPTAEQSAALEQLLEDQRNPSSPDYHNWLTPEEFGDRFGLSPNDLAKIRSWLESEGMQVTQVARARNWILFSGSAAQLSRTFQTELRHYEVDGEPHYANAAAPAVPAALAGVVGGIAGLDDFRPKPQRIVRKAADLNPDFNASNGSHYLAPDDLAAIYNISAFYKAGYDGLGLKLAIGGQTDINLSDMRAFRSQFGLSARDPQVVLAGSDPGVSPGDQIEADLDLEWSGAVARNATIVYVNSPNVFQSVQYAIDQNLAPVISLSYGACEIGVSASYRSMVQQANAQGITWMNSSGDSGAAGCDWNVPSASHGPAVAFPADLPEVTAVGGTEFSELNGAGWASQNGVTFSSATGYLPEKAWNDTSASNGIAASGGGASVIFTKPWWQTGPGVPKDGARDVPDISLSASGAHDGYLIFANGSLIAVGGTSASSPSFAGVVTLLNQYLVANGMQARPGLGNINPSLYSLAQSAPSAFHDITTANNIVPCAAGSTGCPASGSFGYNAGVGYDLVTGLGSVDTYKLATVWSTASGVGTTMTLAANPATVPQTGTSQLTATITPVSGANPPTGTVAFVAGTVMLGSEPVTASGGNGTATLTVKGSALAPAANIIVATYTATGNFAGSTAQTAVTVTTAVPTVTTLTASPASLAATATTQLIATVRPATGTAAPTGTVTFALGNTSLGSAPLTASGAVATGTLTVKGSGLATGNNTIAAAFTATGGFSTSSGTVQVAVTAPAVSTSTSLAATLLNIPANGTTQLTATVRAASGSATPGGSVTFNAGTVVLGTASLTGSGAAATATLIVKAASLAAGANALVAGYGGSSAFLASASAPVTVTIAPPPAATTTFLTAAAATIAQSGAVVVTATVKPAATGSIVFSAGGVSLGTGTLVNSAASLTIKGTSLAVGANAIAGTYSGSAASAASSGTVTVTVTGPPIATAIGVTASPVSFPQTATTQLTATVKPASGSSPPTGSVSFSFGATSLGSAPLAAAGPNATATLTIKGSSLPAGSTSISAAYGTSGNFAASAGSVTVNVTAPPVATATTLAAGPAGLLPTDSTILTATVKPASGSSTPAGTVTFTNGNTTLGTAPLAGTPGTASLTVKGSSLAVGGNAITATYSGSAGFTGSNASLTVTVAAPAVATKLTSSASPANIVQTASTRLTATVAAAAGGALPTGSVTFTVGNTRLGTAPLVVSGGTAAATLAVPGNSLAAGANLVTATYPAAAGFSPSSATVTITVTVPASNVAASATVKTKTSQGLPVTVQLQEQAGVATTLTGVTINGTNFTSSIVPLFGSTQLPARGSLSANLYIQWSPTPASLVFAFTGTDASGRQWSQTVTASTTMAAK